MHQPFHVDVLQLHEQAKTGDAGNDALEHITDLIAHVFALQPANDIPGGFIGPALGHGALLPQLHHGGGVIGQNLLLGNHRCARHALDVGGFLATADKVTNGTVHQQIRITPDG